MATAKNSTPIEDEAPPVTENFSDLLKDTLGDQDFEGRVVKGTVVSLDSDCNN